MTTESITEATFDIMTETDGLMSLAIKQDNTLSKRAAPIVESILASDDPANTARLVFLRARGPYLMAKKSGAKEKASALGRAWNRSKTLLDHHAKQSGYKITWPNWATGEGDVTVTALDVARAAEKAKKIARDAADAEAIALSEADAQAARVAAIRVLGPDDLAEQIADTIRTWGGNPADVLSALATRFAVAA